jgi:hypothetical protein
MGTDLQKGDPWQVLCETDTDRSTIYAREFPKGILWHNIRKRETKSAFIQEAPPILHQY